MSVYAIAYLWLAAGMLLSAISVLFLIIDPYEKDDD